MGLQTKQTDLEEPLSASALSQSLSPFGGSVEWDHLLNFSRRCPNKISSADEDEEASSSSMSCLEVDFYADNNESASTTHEVLDVSSVSYPVELSKHLASIVATTQRWAIWLYACVCTVRACAVEGLNLDPLPLLRSAVDLNIDYGRDITLVNALPIGVCVCVCA
jgi:hypothetical protein